MTAGASSGLVIRTLGLLQSLTTECGVQGLGALEAAFPGISRESWTLRGAHPDAHVDAPAVPDTSLQGSPVQPLYKNTK